MVDKRSGHYTFVSRNPFRFNVWRGCDSTSPTGCWNTLLQLDMKTLEWAQITVDSNLIDSARVVKNAAYAQFADIVYSYGGEMNGKSSNVLTALYSANGKWVHTAVTTTSESIETPALQDATLSVVGGVLYLWGGQDNGEPRNTLYGCDLRNSTSLTCTWKVIATNGNPPPARYGHSATLVGSSLLIFGGVGQNGDALADLWRLSFWNSSFTWSMISASNTAAAPAARAFHTMTLVPDSKSISRKMIVVGGYNMKDTVYSDVKIYDISSRSWQNPPSTLAAGLPMVAAKRLSALFLKDSQSTNGQIVLSGGCDNGGQCYNVLKPLILDFDAVCAGTGPGACRNGNYSESATKIATCACQSNFKGKFCEQAEVCLNNCNGNGVCSGGVCQCNLGFGGADCKEPVCANDCGGRARGDCSKS